MKNDLTKNNNIIWYWCLIEDFKKWEDDIISLKTTVAISSISDDKKEVMTTSWEIFRKDNIFELKSKEDATNNAIEYNKKAIEFIEKINDNLKANK